MPRAQRAPATRPAPSVRLPEEAVLLDLLVEVRPWHLDRARRLAHVPVVLAQLGEDVGALGALLELGEARRVEQVRGQRAGGLRARDQAVDVGGGDLRPAREDEEPLDGVAQLAHVARPLHLTEALDGRALEAARRQALLLYGDLGEVADE